MKAIPFTPTRVCKDCGEEKPSERFKPDNRAVSGYTSTCKDCWNAAHRQWRRDNPVDQRRRSRNDGIRQSGLTPEAYETLLDAQNHRCAICGATEPAGIGRWHIDHDHSCCPGQKRPCGRCVRGLLCHNCNIVLGLVRDDPARLRSAAEYLERRRRG